MSFDLSALRFDVDTSRLEVAVKMVDDLGKAVQKLKKPLSEMGTAAEAGANGVANAADGIEQSSKKQTKQVDVMSQAVKAFYKEQEKLAKEDQKRQEQMLAAGASMNDQAVKAYEKYLDQQYKSLQALNAKKLKEVEKSAKDELTVLEKLKAQVKYVSQGSSRGEASALARAEFSGQGIDIPDIKQQQRTVRKLIGGDPFDKSSSGLNSMNQELGQAREGYRQMVKYQEEFNRLQKEGNGEELRLVGLNRKETDNLYRDKQRMIEQYKLLKSSQFDASDTVMIEKQKNAYKDLAANVKNLETTYKQVATAKRPLENLRTVDATKRADELRYLARATSVQLGDIGISLAGGQNPLTVFLQQGDQLRGVFNQVGASAAEMKEGLSTAFSQIVVGFKDVALVLGKFVLGAFVDTGKAIVKFATDITFITPALDYLRAKLVATTGETSMFVKAFDKVGSVIGGVVATGMSAGIVGLIGMAFAYKELITVSKNLSIALATNGAAIAINKEEALAMSSALAGAKGTSMDVAAAITEIAKAGNLGKENIAGITSVALDMQRYAGVAVHDTVAAYSKLADDPVKALTELGMATGRVTVAQIENIRTLVEQGKMHEAVAEAIKIKQAADEEATASMIANMSPLERLWDDMKDKIKDAKEEFFILVNATGNVEAFTTAWEGLAAVVNAVWFAMKEIGRTMGAIGAGVASFANVDTIKSLLSRDIGSQSVQKASQDAVNVSAMFREDSDKNLESFLKSNKAIWQGVEAKKKANDVDTAGNKLRREQIEAATNLEKLEDKLGTKRVLNAEQRAKKISDSKSKVDQAINPLLNAAGANKAELEAKRKALYGNIEETYKPKKAKGGDSAARDEFSSQIEALKNKQKAEERIAKETVARVNHEYKMGTLSEIDLINQVAAAEEKALKSSITSLEAEQAIAGKKKNSKKEVAKIQGDIEKATEQLRNREITQSRAIEEQQHKIEIAYKDTVNARMAEVYSMQEKNKQAALDIEAIGLTAGALAQLTAKRQEEFIVKQKSKIATLELKNADGKNTAAIQAETMMLEEMTRARNLEIDAKYKEAKVRLLGTDLPASESKKIIGSATETAVRSNVSDQAIIDLKKQALELDKLQVIETGNITVADRERFTALEAEIARMQERMTLTLTIAGIEDISTQFQGLMGNMAAASQANADAISASINKMGASYQGQFKGMLKDAKAQADQYARIQKATGGVTSSLKTLSEAQKKGKEGSAERFNAEVGGYAEMAGAAAEYFDKNSEGYALMKDIEMGFRAFQMAASIAAMVQGKAETADAVADSGTKAIASTAAGVAKAFEQMGVWGFIGAAAIIAFMASMGVGGGGGGSSFGTLGAGNQIDASGNKTTRTSKYNTADDHTAAPEAKSEAEIKEMYRKAEIDAAANALNDLRAEARKLAENSSELESNLYKVQLAVNGAGIAAHDVATEGMTEAEIAAYDYNMSLRAQTGVLLDLANGTEFTSENMKKLAEESAQLSIDLMEASGNIAGARAAQRLLDTGGYTAEEVAVYDNNQRQKDAIEAAKAGASAARDAINAELELAQTRHDIADRLNILLGRTTQKEVERANELASTTDSASIGMLKLIYQLEDLTSNIDIAFATLERSIAAEKKLVEVRLSAATALQSILKTAKDATISLTRVQAQAQLTVMLAAFKSSGLLPEADALKPALTAIAKPSEDLFSNFVDYQRDFLKTARAISELSDAADTQVSIEQATLDKLDAQLESARLQIDAIKGVDNSVKNVATAVNDVTAAINALATAQAGAGNYSYAAPPPNASSGGGGGYSGYGGSGGSSTPTYEDVTEMTNRDIVAAYRAYYNRNPDQQGYKNYVDSKLSGDKLMQAILSGSSGNKDGADYKTAVSKGYDPSNPLAKWYKVNSSSSSNNSPLYGGAGSQGGFAIGINYVPYDMKAQIHKGERILPAADNAELFARLASPEQNAAALAQAVVRLTAEVQNLRVEARQTVVNTGDTSKMLKRLGGEQDILTVRLET